MFHTRISDSSIPRIGGRPGGWGQAVWWLVFWLWSGTCPPALAGQSVTLLLSEQGGIYEEAAQALSLELERDAGQWTVRSRDVDTTSPADGTQGGIVVAIGLRALEYALSARDERPLLALLVPRSTFEMLMSERAQTGRRRPVSALFLDQPFTRQLRLIRLALPQAGRVGVLVGPATEGQVDGLKKAGVEVGLDVDIRSIQEPEQLFSSLDALGREVDVLLMLPDPMVVNRQTLRSLLLRTYRKRLPVVAYSAGLVQAGALLGVYASPAQLGTEAGKWLRVISWNAAKPVTVKEPESFSVDVNLSVARSLELRLPSSEELAARLATGGAP